MSGPNGELDWHFCNWNEELGVYAYEQLHTMDTILVGRRTYETMASHWPHASRHNGAKQQDIAFADRMNQLPKIVFSTTLKKVYWNNSRLVKDHISEEVQRLKRQPGMDMIMWGGVGIVSSFVKLNLIDEYRIFVSPVVIGRGKPLFREALQQQQLRLLEVRPFSNGVVLCRYLKGF